LSHGLKKMVGRTEDLQRRPEPRGGGGKDGDIQTDGRKKEFLANMSKLRRRRESSCYGREPTTYEGIEIPQGT